jgi:hypothetical protein
VFKQETRPRGAVPSLTLLPHFWIGIALVAFFWFASWTHWGALGEYSFLPLWVGYILTMDALVAARRGSSLLTAQPRHLLLLFGISAPIWWLFEGLNTFTENWHYLIPPDYSPLHIILQATTNFAIVIPAVFETAMLLGTLPFFENLRRTRLRLTFTRNFYRAFMFLGAGMFFGIWLLPNLAYGLIWVWLFMLLDAQNALRARPSLLAQVARGDVRNLVLLGLATLTCGFFWELWNYQAFPKWYYTVPGLDWAHVFEMPLVGYIGYVPFSWELYALYQFACGVTHIKPLSEFDALNP